MNFLVNLFEHWRHFSACAQSRGGMGSVDLSSLKASVQIGGRRHEFIAQFLIRRPDGSLTYNVTLDASAEGFIGWLPYFNKRWPEAVDKLAFKGACARAGLPTPAASPQPSAALGDFLIKRSRGSSFGQGIRGPFAAAADRPALAADEFAEAFVPGEIGKAWYWNERLVALELRTLPTLVGDGFSNLGEIMRRRSVRADIAQPTAFMQYRGIDWSYVPERSESVQLDYRYGSPYYRPDLQDLDRLSELKEQPVGQQLAAWGATLWSFVPEAIRAGTLYTVDFMQGKDGKDWLLEMNCNPMVPPGAYEVIFASLFGAAPSPAKQPVLAPVGEGPVRPQAQPAPAPTPSPLPAMYIDRLRKEVTP